MKWWPAIKRTLKSNGLLIVDNTTSHAAEMEEFMALVRDDEIFSHALAPVGNGQFIANKFI